MQEQNDNRLSGIQEETTAARLTRGPEATRRNFIGGALAGVAALLDTQTAEAQQACPSSTSCQPAIGAELVNPGEIVRGSDGFLRGVVTVEGEMRTVSYYKPAQPVGNFLCQTHMLRAYHGYQGFTTSPSKRVTSAGVAGPGPTLRAKVGDTLEIMFLNRINKQCFPETALTGEGGGCEVTKDQAGKELYPQNQAAGNPTIDKFPDCFRVSNTTNLHFHGTHVSPGGFADNVLVGVLPNRGITAAAAIEQCAAFYRLCNPGDSDPYRWKVLGDRQSQQRWRAFQAWYAVSNANLAQLSPAAVTSNDTAFLQGEWPQYWPGYYPYWLTIPKYDPAKPYPEAGQSPGTHWYHAHQHGSTSIQLLNGMAGVIILTGDTYDGQILTLGGGTAAAPRIKEKVMILQLFAEVTNLMAGGLSGGGSPQSLMVNGQLMPTVTMKQNEVQWWRIANASIRSHGIQNFFFIEKSKFDALPANTGDPIPQPTDVGLVPAFREIARDGVQFAWANYQRRSNSTEYRLSPGNRADLLVQAPKQDGEYLMVFWPPASSKENPGPAPAKDKLQQIVLKVNVSGTPTTENTEWYDPTLTTPPANYPIFPDYLTDLPESAINIHRKVTFSMDGGPGTQPKVMIDGKQFNDGIINKVMLQGDTEEWLLVNKSKGQIQHPFHIHINPFQIIETFDPSKPDQPVMVKDQYVWGDTVAIPAGLDVNGKFTPGHVKIRTKFLDFSGKFVLHCHILGHEDRGMMQLIEVVSNKTILKHH